MKNIFHVRIIAIAILLLQSVAAIADYLPGDKRSFDLYCNGTPCAIDSTNFVIYCSIKPVKGDSIDISFDSKDFTKIMVDHEIYNINDTLRIKNDLKNTYDIRFKGGLGLWTLKFTTLPIVMLDATRLERFNRHHGYITIIDPYKRTNNTNLFIHFAGLKVRGASASGLPKKPFSVELWDANRDEVDLSVMGMRKDGDIILDAMYYDKARMRNRVCFDFWNKIDSIPYPVKPNQSRLNGTQGFFVEVLVNGKYNGLYCLTDKIDRKKLHLKKTEISTTSTKNTIHGILYKARQWSDATMFNDFDTNASTKKLEWCGWEQKYPDDNNSMADWDPLKKLIKFSAPKLNGNNSYFSFFLDRKFYMQNLVNYVLFVNVFHLRDNHCKNTYISYYDIADKEAKAYITPWDMDATLGRNWDGASMSNKYSFDPEVMDVCGLFKRLIKDNPSNFNRDLHDTWIRWSKSYFSVDSVRNHVYAYRDLFESSGAYSREMQRWPGSPENIQKESRFIVDWYQRCFNWTNRYLKDFPSDIKDIINDTDITVDVRANGNHISINAVLDEPATISIYDINGVLVEKAETDLPFESQELNKGIYIINIKIGGTTIRRKIAVC